MYSSTKARMWKYEVHVPTYSMCDFIESNSKIHLHRHPESQDILSEAVVSIVRCLKPFSRRQFHQNQGQETFRLIEASMPQSCLTT